MNIVVCIKQVPEIALVRVDSSEGVILPDGPGAMNPFDEYAVEEGLRLKEKNGGTVTVVSCGEEASVACLRDALALGADRAIHLVDPAFTGSDGIALGAILAAAVQKIGDVDICLFGKNAVDTDRFRFIDGNLHRQGDIFADQQDLFTKLIFNDLFDLFCPGRLNRACDNPAVPFFNFSSFNVWNFGPR